MARLATAGSWTQGFRRMDPLQPIWRLFTSVRFALGLICFLAIAGLLSVVLPQVPLGVRDNPAATAAWVEFQKGKFGIFTEPMYRLGLFNIFAAPWFLLALGLLVIAVTVCTVNRFPPIWRNVTRPPERVPDRYFDRARNRAHLPGVEPTRLVEELKRRWFRVRTFREGDTTYLFADRFAWAQLATFVSHLALIMFLAGGLVSRFGGYTYALFIAEGESRPVLPLGARDQILVEVKDAIARFDEEGLPLDYRTELVLYQGGREVMRGVTTVNDPLTYGGYRFHQAAYLGEGAALRVRDVTTGNTLYQEVLALQDFVPAPAITVQDGRGRTLLDDVIVPTDFLGPASGTFITLPTTGDRFWVGVNQSEDNQWQLVIFNPEDERAQATVPKGESRQIGPYVVTLQEVTALPATMADAIPGAAASSRVIMSALPGGEPYVTVIGPVERQALVLVPGQPVRVGDKEYLFEGRRAFAGIEVRRDPGTTFIWVATGLLLGGLLVTFYLPRLRLWARVRGDEVVIAGLEERGPLFRAEVERLARTLGAGVRLGEQGRSG